MSEYRGDFTLGANVDIKFTTRKFSTGAPLTLAGSPVISAYADNSTTQLTAGITLTVDFDSVTGLNHVRVVASGGNGYASGSSYDLVITTGTVDAISVVGEVIGSFSIEARSALRPTTAGRTLDVSAGGEAGVDWANVGSPTTTLGLSGTTIKAVTDNVGVGTIAANAVNASALATDAVTEIQTGLATSASITSLDTKLGTPAGASVSADIAAVKSETAAIKTKTDNLPPDPADASDIAARTLPSANYATAAAQTTLQTSIDNLPIENADVLLDRNMATGTDSGTSTVRTVRQALRFLRNKWGPDGGGNISVRKEDDATESWKFVPTTTPGADPITGCDPEGP